MLFFFCVLFIGSHRRFVSIRFVFLFIFCLFFNISIVRNKPATMCLNFAHFTFFWCPMDAFGFASFELRWKRSFFISTRFVCCLQQTFTSLLIFFFVHISLLFLCAAVKVCWTKRRKNNEKRRKNASNRPNEVKHKKESNKAVFTFAQRSGLTQSERTNERANDRTAELTKTKNERTKNGRQSEQWRRRSKTAANRNSVLFSANESNVISERFCAKNDVSTNASKMHVNESRLHSCTERLGRWRDRHWVQRQLIDLMNFPFSLILFLCTNVSSRPNVVTHWEQTAISRTRHCSIREFVRKRMRRETQSTVTAARVFLSAVSILIAHRTHRQHANSLVRSKRMRIQ